MLSELRVSQLGVIEDLALTFGPGMTALTGETGAGKTLVVEAVELLAGGRAEAVLVRPGAPEAVVEGRFIRADESGGTEEVVLKRVVPVEGRARAYLDGSMAAASALAETSEGLIDLHGQHAHQSLLSTAAQRGALDAFSRLATELREERDRAREEVRRLGTALASVGGDLAARGREMQLLAFQIDEIEAAELRGPGEDAELAAEEDALGRAAAHRSAALSAYEALAGEDQLLDRLGAVAASVAGRGPMSGLAGRMSGALAELSDLASELRAVSESLEEDPARLAAVVDRRARLRELARKYRPATGPSSGPDDVLAFLAVARSRLNALRDQETVSAALTAELADASARLAAASGQLGDARRQAAIGLAEAVEGELRNLAMPRARFHVLVGAAPTDQPPVCGVDLAGLAGEEVSFLLGANPGEPLLPLSKVASGGELARAMLALRLVLSGPAPPGTAGAPPTLVFDEVDAGVGGEAAVAVGAALARLGRSYQVFVVTHLAQVAACADAHVAVSKSEVAGRTVAGARAVTGPERVRELSRMLSGRPDSTSARAHAEELLHLAKAPRRARK